MVRLWHVSFQAIREEEERLNPWKQGLVRGTHMRPRHARALRGRTLHCPENCCPAALGGGPTAARPLATGST